MNYFKVRFYLLGYKGYKVLLDVIQKYGKDCIEDVIIGMDRNIENDYSEEIKKTCIREGIKIFAHKNSVNNTDNFAFAIGWKWILKSEQAKNLIILHDSILPKYRGFNPLVSALINGEKQIGVTALLATNKYDEGDIISQSVYNVTYPLKINEAINFVSELYSKLVIKIIEIVQKGSELPRAKQDNSLASYSLWRDEKDYQIDWNWDNEKLLRFINATGYPYRGAKTTIENEVIRILEADILDDLKIENRTPGKIIFFDDTKPVVVCGKGLLKVNKMIRDIDRDEFKLKKFRVRFQ